MLIISKTIFATYYSNIGVSTCFRYAFSAAYYQIQLKISSRRLFYRCAGDVQLVTRLRFLVFLLLLLIKFCSQNASFACFPAIFVKNFTHYNKIQLPFRLVAPTISFTGHCQHQSNSKISTFLASFVAAHTFYPFFSF